MPRWLKVALAVLLGLLVLAGAAFVYLWYAPAPREPQLSAAIEKASIRVGDRDRTYLAYAPAKLPADRPLVIVLHGSGMTGAEMRRWTGYGFDVLADREGFAVLYPDGYGHTWNDCRNSGTFPAKRENVDDLSFIRALIARLHAERGIDLKKVYVLGYSNGGHMAFRLATQAPDAIAAIAAVAASLPVPAVSWCGETGRTSRVMLVNGSEDPLSPFQGGNVSLFGFINRGPVRSSRATTEAFAERNGIRTPLPAVKLPHHDPSDPTAVVRQTWLLDGRPYVEFDAVIGGGHVVPQPRFRYPRLLGKTTQDLDAPVRAWAFFNEAPTEPPPGPSR